MPHRLTLSEMAAQIRARKLSPLELVDAHLKNIEAHDPAINAFIRVFGDEAREQAKVLENASLQGALPGIPVSVKDSFDLAGVPTTCGSTLFQDLKATRDATAVARMKQAGAIVIGKTNCPEFLSNYESDNFVIGRSNNPWNLERTPGGSSGGESAALAARFSAGGIGSDGGGSIRVPAHFTGICGLKPTPGRVPATGHIPEMNHPTGMIGVAGPMARTAEDLKLLFGVMCGYDPGDPFSVPMPCQELKTSGVKVGVVEHFPGIPVQPAVAKALNDAGRCLSDLRVPTDAFALTGLERAPNLWWFFFGELPARSTKAFIAGREEKVHWTGTEFLDQALMEAEPSAGKVLENFAIRDSLRAALLTQMDAYPVLLMPVSSVTAFAHKQRKYKTSGKDIGQFQAMMSATFVNLVGLPSVTLPFGLDADGLPCGVQLIGRPYEEEVLLDLAIQLESARGAFPAPPLIGRS